MSETYAKYRLPDLWKSVAAEDPEAGFAHVNALNRLRVALEQQRDNLRIHRDRLVEGWPPERSEAAATFVDRINGLIDVLTATAGATGRICVGVDEAYSAMREVRRQLESMMAQYSKRPAGAGLTVSNAGNPQLDQQARDAYIAADAKVVRASVLINSGIAWHYQKEDSRELASTDQSGVAGPGSSGGSHTSGQNAQSAMLRAPVFDPPVPSGADDGSSAFEGGRVRGDDGLMLTGGSGVQPASAGTSVPTSVPGPTGLIIGNDGAKTGSPAVGRVDPFALPPGSVIGTSRPTGPGGSQPGAVPMAGPGSRTNPTATSRRSAAGRSIGQPDAGGARGNGPASGGYRDRSFESYVERRRSKHTEGEELWSVEEGVPPVIDVATERPHDPGPGVIGMDR
ncbi:hypothetical protein [Dactylosporangium sp. CA-233914]|uniref:hypothetical protein n=1 Tax=Dactylosporangium sp. CA-233914 TaxID=3239934 RepID=UPI003D8A4E24